MLGYLPTSDSPSSVRSFVEKDIDALRRVGQRVDEVGDHYETRQGGEVIIWLKD